MGFRCSRGHGWPGAQADSTPLFLALPHTAAHSAHSGRRRLLIHCEAATSQASTEGESASSPDESARLLTLVRGFERRVVTTRGVELRVRPLATQHLEEVTDLLTDSFMDLLGTFTYRPLLRLEVRQSKRGALRARDSTGGREERECRHCREREASRHQCVVG